KNQNLQLSPKSCLRPSYQLHHPPDRIVHGRQPGSAPGSAGLPFPVREAQGRDCRGRIAACFRHLRLVNPAASSTLQELVREGAGYLEAREVPSARFDAQVLLSHALGISRSDLLQRSDEAAPEAASRHYRESLRRRGERVPLQHLTGVQEFWSLDFEVSPAALIPRPETELLVEEALRHAAGSS